MKFLKPKYGETRVVTVFLLFPKKIGHETRWLERAQWVEVFDSRRPPGSMAPYEAWHAVAWGSVWHGDPKPKPPRRI